MKPEDIVEDALAITNKAGLLMYSLYAAVLVIISWLLLLGYNTTTAAPAPINKQTQHFVKDENDNSFVDDITHYTNTFC